jgi:transposase
MKLNGTGFFGLNCNSSLYFTPNTQAFEFAKIFINIRLELTNDPNIKKILTDALNHENLTKEYIISILKRKRDSEYEYREKINNKIYDEKINREKTNKHIIDYAKRQDPKNPNKIKDMERKNLLKNLNTEETINILAKEKKINILLDNYTTHHAELIKDITEILNINLINLPKYSPDLNPIEDVWSNTKDEVFNKFIENTEELKEFFENTYYEEVKNESYYSNWANEYLPVMEKS